MMGRVRFSFAALYVLWLMFKSAIGIGEAPELDSESGKVKTINGQLTCIGENSESKLIGEGGIGLVEDPRSDCE